MLNGNTGKTAKRITHAIFTFISSALPMDAPDSAWDDADWIRARYGELREEVGFTAAERQAVTEWIEMVMDGQESEETPCAQG